jgi:hypothetical protein
VRWDFSRKEKTMNFKKLAFEVSLVAVAVLALAASPAFAEITKDTWYIEGGTGYFRGDGDSQTKAKTETIPGDPPEKIKLYEIKIEVEVENGYLINFRVGRFFAKHWGVESLLWFSPTELTGSAKADIIDVEFPESAEFTDRVEVDITGIDGSIVYCPNPSGKFNVLLLGGAGLLSTELFEGSRGSGSYSLHLGAAAKIFVTDKLYIRTDVRYLDVNGLDLGFYVNGLDSIKRAKEYIEDESDFDVTGPDFDFDGTSQLNFTTATVSIGWVFGK